MERGVLARGGTDDPLLDRDGARGRRRHDIQRVAEDVGHPRGEEDRLDVVAVDRISRTAQGSEPVLGSGELLGQDRVTRYAALRPQLTADAGLLALVVAELDRRRAGDRLAVDPVVVLVIQRRRGLGHDRTARKRVSDLGQVAPWTTDRETLVAVSERKRPVRQRAAGILRRGLLDRGVHQPA